jgi:hypothetical protein
VAAIAGVERMEAGADQALGVRAGRVRAPRDRTGLAVDRGQPAAHAELAAGVSDQDTAVDGDRRHRHGLALVDVAELGVEHLAAGRRVDRDQVIVERREVDLAVGEHRAAVDQVAARDAAGGIIVRRLVSPQHRAAVREVERDQPVGERRDQVHGRADHQRRGLVPVARLGIEAPRHREPCGVAGRDLIELRIAGVCEVAGGHRPLAIVGAWTGTWAEHEAAAGRQRRCTGRR